MDELSPSLGRCLWKSAYAPMPNKFRISGTAKKMSILSCVYDIYFCCRILMLKFSLIKFSVPSSRWSKPITDRPWAVPCRQRSWGTRNKCNISSRASVCGAMTSFAAQTPIDKSEKTIKIIAAGVFLAIKIQTLACSGNAKAANVVRRAAWRNAEFQNYKMQVGMEPNCWVRTAPRFDPGRCLHACTGVR